MSRIGLTVAIGILIVQVVIVVELALLLDRTGRIATLVDDTCTAVHGVEQAVDHPGSSSLFDRAPRAC